LFFIFSHIPILPLLGKSIVEISISGGLPVLLVDITTRNWIERPDRKKSGDNQQQGIHARTSTCTSAARIVYNLTMPFSSSELTLAGKSALLQGLDQESIMRITQASSSRSLPDGAFFFMEGDPAEQAYLLLDGKVKLIQVTPHGQQVILGYLVPGRVFGIISVLKKVTFPVSAQTVGACKAAYWDQRSLNHLMEVHPRIALNTLRIMAGQIRQFQNTVKDLSTQRVEQRIARAVLRLARQSGRKTGDGILIDLPLSRQDLAEMTGTTLYTVSRVFKEWEQRGLVHSKRQQVIILYPHGLVTIAEDLPQGISSTIMAEDDLCDGLQAA
jgi:CRP-like cAMP-binding protein